MIKSLPDCVLIDFILKTYTKSNEQNVTCNFGKKTCNRFNFIAFFVTSYRYSYSYMFSKCNELLLPLLKNVTITCNYSYF
jgi:hypothetical protein